MILQLAKTSPYLTGQFKLDIELHMTDEGIRTGNCHVSPLADNLGETDSSDVPFFNCKLTDSIKRLYNRLGDAFFSDSPAMYSEKILYNNDPTSNHYTWQDCYDHTYQAGVSRMRYEKYKKQFQLLCPVWFDDPSELLSTEFVFKIRGWDTNVETAETILKIIPDSDLDLSLNEYLEGLTPDLLNINLDRKEFFIKGLEVPSGTVITKDVSYYLEKMLDRERPVIETDSMLCQLLPSNKMIARQMLNLNFCFNMTDIMPPYLANAMQMQQWTVWCDMRRIGENGQYVDIPFKDLYTNYWHIPSYVADDGNGHFDDSRNSLDYLEDNRCIDYIDENKVTQPIFHWSLLDNPDYLYNFYNGFSPISKDEDGNDTLMQGLFFSQPNPYQKDYKYGANTMNWCKIIDLRNSSNVNTRLINMYTEGFPGMFTKFELDPGSVYWVNGMKFYGKEEAFSSFYVNIVYVDEDELSLIYSNNFGTTPQSFDPSKAVPYLHDAVTETVSLLIAPNNQSVLDNMAMSNLLDGTLLSHVYSDNSTNTILSELESIFKYYVYPWTIEFNKSLYGERVDSPDNNSKELRYYKSDINHYSKIYRYTGNLIPMTVMAGDSSNYNWDFFYKKMDSAFLSTENGAAYNEYMKTGYPQKYPSIGYFPLEPVKASYTPDMNRYPLGYEVKWYKNGRVWNLPEEIEISANITPGQSTNDEFFYGLLSNKLTEELNDPTTSTSSALSGFPSAFNSQLYGVYSYKADWDYVSETDITSFIAKVKYKLR